MKHQRHAVDSSCTELRVELPLKVWQTAVSLTSTDHIILPATLSRGGVVSLELTYDGDHKSVSLLISTEDGVSLLEEQDGRSCCMVSTLLHPVKDEDTNVMQAPFIPHTDKRICTLFGTSSIVGGLDAEMTINNSAVGYSSVVTDAEQPQIEQESSCEDDNVYGLTEIAQSAKEQSVAAENAVKQEESIGDIISEEPDQMKIFDAEVKMETVDTPPHPTTTPKPTTVKRQKQKTLAQPVHARKSPRRKTEAALLSQNDFAKSKVKSNAPELTVLEAESKGSSSVNKRKRNKDEDKKTKKKKVPTATLR